MLCYPGELQYGINLYPFTDEWKMKTWYLPTLEYYSTLKKEILLFVTVDGSVGHYLREINQAQKRQLFYNIYVWNLKNPQKQGTESWMPGAVENDGEMRHMGTKASVGQGE